jgi:hypothetical protein
MTQWLIIDVPCIECGGEGGEVGELLDFRPEGIPIVKPGNEMPVIKYHKSKFAIEIEERSSNGASVR